MTQTQPRLARGLDALIPGGTSSPRNDRLHVGRIQHNPYQPRKRFDDETLDGLARSIREVGILQLLHASAGRVVDRDTFFNRLWGLEHVPNSRTLDQQISKLRRRIERDPTRPTIIRTVHGSGYRHDG